ncbi:DMT family transporter [Catellatospora methionotrophica]|uniref:DMT family transporter n=1 Tax=Catellatospora methionotrophica TaxID=121620 RepID=UPI001409051F|nr:DMT family transporter [Catellatospora methionotrophica]
MPRGGPTFEQGERASARAARSALGVELLALALPVSGGQAITWRVDAVASVVVLGVLGTGAAYVLNYRLIADVGPTAASVVTYLLPVVAVALGAVFLAETPTAAMVGGTVLVLAGVLLTQRAGSPRRS